MFLLGLSLLWRGFALTCSLGTLLLEYCAGVPALTPREDAIHPHVPANFCSVLESPYIATSTVLAVTSAYAVYTYHVFIDCLRFEVTATPYVAESIARIMAATVRTGRALGYIPPTTSPYLAVQIRLGRRTLCTGTQFDRSAGRPWGLHSVAALHSGASSSTTHNATICRSQRGFPARYVAVQRRMFATVKHGEFDELANYTIEY